MSHYEEPFNKTFRGFHFLTILVLQLCFCIYKFILAFTSWTQFIDSSSPAEMSRHLFGGCEGRANWGAVGGLARALTLMLHCRSRMFRSGLMPYAVLKYISIINLFFYIYIQEVNCEDQILRIGFQFRFDTCTFNDISHLLEKGKP